MMTATPTISTNNTRVNKKRGSGKLFMICVIIFFGLLVLCIRYEQIVEPLHGADRPSQVTTKSDFAWNPQATRSGDREKMKMRKKYDRHELSKKKISAAIDDDEIFLPLPKNRVYKPKPPHLKLTHQSQKGRNGPYGFGSMIVPDRQYKENHKGLRRQEASTIEKIQTIPIIPTIDNTIPAAVEGSIIHAVDALLCRESVLDYVINATDLKDECDGLRKAYTQTCATNEENNQETKSWQRQRRLEKQTNPLTDWQGKLFSLFDRFLLRSPKSPMRTYRFLNEKKNSDQEVSFSTADAQEVRIQQNRNKTSASKNKKMLANLALPVTSKHVSEKMLTETLMLQQDDKIMKAVANQTNHTVSEAQADAVLSANAIAEAADMVSNVLNDPTSVEARTCCTSILNVFHENCNVDEEEELSDRRLFVGVAVIALCGLVKSLIRHFQIRWLPEAAGCIMVGVTVGYILTFYPHHDISFDGNLFLRIMVPPIVFEAALSIDKRSFSRHIVPILFYAVLGTLVATGATAIAVHEGSKFLHCETIPYAEALTFGALISSIDPIAVLSVLSNMGMTDQDTIYVVIFGESLLNDGVAIVLFETLVHFLDDNMIVDSHAVTAAAVHFLVVFIGSLLIGLGYGLGCTLYYWMMYGCQTSLVEVLMFCCWALLPYYVCDGIEWSGIVAVVAAGFIMDMYVVGTDTLDDSSNDETDFYGDDSDRRKERRRKPMSRRPIFSKEGLLSKEAKTHITFVTEIIATMMETAIFAYLGLFLFSSRYHWNHDHLFIAISGCCLSRAIMIPFLSSIANWITKSQQSRAICTFHEIHQQFNQLDTASSRSNQAAGVVIDSKMQLVLWFAGLRGAMSFALVEYIPQYDAVSGEGTRFKSELKAMTSACIIFTVFLLGGGTFYMMEALGMTPKSGRDFTAERYTEMIELLSSVPSIDTEDGIDNLMDEKQHKSNEARDSTSSAGMYAHTSNNTLRRPGRPVRRQRNTVST